MSSDPGIDLSIAVTHRFWRRAESLNCWPEEILVKQVNDTPRCLPFLCIGTQNRFVFTTSLIKRIQERYDPRLGAFRSNKQGKLNAHSLTPG